MRLASIDVLRSIAIVIMVVVHFLENLSGVREWSPDGFGAPLFAFLSGISARLWAAARTQRGDSSTQITRVLVRRGLFLFGLGLAFNFFVWLPEDFWIWDVLTFLGTASLLLAVIRQMPTSVAILFAALAMIVSPAMQQLAGYPEWWANGYYEPGETLAEILLGFLVVGYFPLFPWIALPVTGFLVAVPFVGNDRSRSSSQAPLGRYLLLPAAILAAISGSLLLAGTWFPQTLLQWTMFPASIPYLTGMTSTALLLLYVCHRWLDQPAGKLPADKLPANNRTASSASLLLRIATLFSRYSLTLYLLHHIVHIYPLWIAGLLVQGDPTVFWSQSLHWSLSLILAVIFLVAAVPLVFTLERRRTPTIETVMRWLCDDNNPEASPGNPGRGL